MMTALSLPLALPELILAVGALALLMLGAWRERSPWAVVDAAIFILGLALLSVLLTRQAPGTDFYGAFIDDSFARFMKSLSLIGSIVTLMLSADFMRRQNIGGFEFPALILPRVLHAMNAQVTSCLPCVRLYSTNLAGNI